MRGVKALFFDVFGTLVDWRTGIARQAGRLLSPLEISLDWLAFADAWRGLYQSTLEPVRSGARAYVSLDTLQRESLERVLISFRAPKLSSAHLDDLTLAWHQLDAWPDVREGLASLRPGFWLAPVSNGSISLSVDLARRNGWCWDAILGADIARNFKPQPIVYRSAVEALGLKAGECLM